MTPIKNNHIILKALRYDVSLGYLLLFSVTFTKIPSLETPTQELRTTTTTIKVYLYHKLYANN